MMADILRDDPYLELNMYHFLLTDVCHIFSYLRDDSIILIRMFL